MRRKLFAWLLVCLMLVGTISVPVLAEGDTDPGSNQSDTGGDNGGGGTGGDNGGGTGGDNGDGGTGGDNGGGTGGDNGDGTGGDNGDGTGGDNGGGTGSGSTGEQTCSHSFGSWTNTGDKHKRICSKCGAFEEAAHLMEGGTITLAPTCTSEGSVSYTCTACGFTKAEVLPKVAHTVSYACDDRCDICDAILEVKHTPNAAWSKNSSGHWHPCTVCGKKIDEADHYPGPAATEEKDQICLTCGYIMTPKKAHTHKFDTGYTSDDTGHWHACSGCDEKQNFEAHVYPDSCGGVCKTCGYEAEAQHDYGQTWSTDETGHWLTCVVCGVEELYEEHIPGAQADEVNPQCCVTCGYELAPPLGAEETTVPEGLTWECDDVYHWQVSADGSKQQEALHTWDNGKDRWDGQVVYTCTVCQAKRVGENGTAEQEEVPAEKSFPWGILLAVICVLLAGVVAVLIFLLKKPSGEGKFAGQSRANRKAESVYEEAPDPAANEEENAEDEEDWDAYIDSL